MRIFLLPNVPAISLHDLLPACELANLFRTEEGHSLTVRTCDLIQMARRQAQVTDLIPIEPVTVESPQFRPILPDLRHF
jgi:hypothetical protein